MSYTKGEWRLGFNDGSGIFSKKDGAYRSCVTINNQLLATVWDTDDREVEFNPELVVVNAKANAKLISAAPNLYEALKEIVDMGSLVPCTPSPEASACYLIDANIIDLAKAAIKKAEL